MLGQRIKTERERLGLTQREVARAAGVDMSTVHRWEVRGVKPQLDQLRALARVFGVSLDDLLAVPAEPEPAASTEPATT